MRTIRILHLSSSDVFGGNEEHIRVCAKYADPEVMNAAVACPEGDFADVLQKGKLRRHPLNMTSKLALSCALKIARIVRENHFDIVHSHNRRTDFFAYLSSFFCAPRAFVTTVHDRVDVAGALSKFMHERLLRSFFRNIYCVSQKTREQVIAFSKCAPEKVHAITNGTDLSKLKLKSGAAEKKKELGIPRDKKVAGMMARMRGANFEKKAHPEFFRAAARELEKRKDVLFVIAGEEEKPRNELKKLCHELKITGDVLFLGPRKEDSLEVISCYDIFVLPSSYEGMPRTLSEAMGIGKAVVATNVDGVPELVKDGENGILVPAGNHEEIAEAVLDYLEHPQKAEKFGARAKEHVFSRFNHEMMVSQLCSHYARIAAVPTDKKSNELSHLLR